MTVTVKIDSKGLQAFIKRTLKDMPKEIDKALYKTAQQGINVILDRTEKGIGTDGRFDKYSPDYELWKSKYVKDWKGVVDLNVTGEMTGAMMATKPVNHRTRLGFTNPQASAKAFWNNRKRKFFEFNKKEINNLGAFFRKELFR